mgnify:CR=1 FL=1
MEEKNNIVPQQNLSASTEIDPPKKTKLAPRSLVKILSWVIYIFAAPFIFYFSLFIGSVSPSLFFVVMWIINGLPLILMILLTITKKRNRPINIIEKIFYWIVFVVALFFLIKDIHFIFG